MRERISRRRFLGTAVTLVASTLVAACTPAASPTKAPAEGSTPAPADATQAPVAIGSQPAEINFWNWWGSTREPLMNQVIEHFQAKYPHIKVNNAVQSWDNRDQLAATAMASKDPPHVMMAYRSETYKYAAQGMIIPIDSYVEARGLDVDEIFYAAEINNQRYEGKLYTMPMPTGGGIDSQYFFNKNLLQEAGFDRPPETWDELRDAIIKTTKMDDKGISILGANICHLSCFVSLLYSNNGNYYSDDGKTVTLNSPEAVETLEYLYSFIPDLYGRVEAELDFEQGWSSTSADFPFYNSKEAMLFTNNSLPGNMRTSAPDFFESGIWGVALMPYNSGNPMAKHRAPSGLDLAWGQVIPKGLPKHLEEAAYLWVEFLCTDPEGGCWFLDQLARPSPVKKCNETPEKLENTPNLATLLEAMTIEASVPISPVHAQVDALLVTAFDDVMYGRAQPKDALDKCTSDGQVILDKYWSENE